jgi:hypothetical protein
LVALALTVVEVALALTAVEVAPRPAQAGTAVAAVSVVGMPEERPRLPAARAGAAQHSAHQAVADAVLHSAHQAAVDAVRQSVRQAVARAAQQSVRQAAAGE